MKVHDRNGDGILTLEDMERSVMKYQVNDGLADANNPGGATYSSNRYEPYISTYTTHQTNRYSNSRNDTFGNQTSNLHQNSTNIHYNPTV